MTVIRTTPPWQLGERPTAISYAREDTWYCLQNSKTAGGLLLPAGDRMSDNTGEPDRPDTPARPSGPYWEDPVFRFLSRQQRSAGDDAQASARLDAFMQDLVGGAISDEAYWELAAEAKADHRQRKLARKGQQTRPPVGVVPGDERSSLNTGDLKKRIFNRHVSRENMIKALEALPPRERAETIAGLPPGLKRKLGSYPKA